MKKSLTRAEKAEMEEVSPVKRGHFDPKPYDELFQQLRRADLAITDSLKRLTKASMEVGWEGAFIRRHEGWKKLGYADEMAYWQAKGVGRSTWYDLTALAEKFPNLTKCEFLSMTILNAKQLAGLPEDTRYNPKLLQAAATKTAAQFHAEMEKWAGDRSKLDALPVDDLYVLLKFRVTDAQGKVIERGLTEWCREHEIPDKGRGLELMVSDFLERPSLVGFMVEWRRRLQAAIETAETATNLDDLRDLRELAAVYLQDSGEILRLCDGGTAADEKVADKDVVA